MAKGPKKDRLAKQVGNCQRQIDHLSAEIVKLQAKIDDPDNTDDEVLEAAMAEAVQSLADQNAKMARLTGSIPPVVDPLPVV